MISIIFILSLLSIDVGNSYFIGKNKNNWGGAQLICQALGTNLATIKSSEDQSSAQSLCFTKAKETGDGCWTGLKHKGSENTFVWADGSNFGTKSYTNWGPAQPNNGEDCMEISRGFNGEWNDSPCSDSLYFLCNSEERVSIKPGKAISDDENIKVKIGKGDNKKVQEKKRSRYVLYGKPSINGAFPLSITLNKREYGFAPRTTDSELAFSVRGICREDACDLATVIGVGDTQYISIVTRKNGPTLTVDIYPKCGSNVANGDATKLLNGASDELAALAGGKKKNWSQLGKRKGVKGNMHFPFTVEVINNAKKGIVTVHYADETFPDGLSCRFKGGFQTKQDVSINLTPLWAENNGNTEIIGIPSVALYGKLFGIDPLPTAQQLLGQELLIGDDEDDDDDDEDEEDDIDWDDYTDDEEFIFMKGMEVGIDNNNNNMMYVLLVSVALIGRICLYKYHGFNKNNKSVDISQNRPLLAV